MTNGIEVDHLTPREKEFLQFIVDNGSTRTQGAADHFGISINTIKAHKHNIYQKFRVDNMTDAVVKAIRLKLVEV